MPSFFDGLKRMLSGQPVFRPGEDMDGVEHKDDQPYKPDQPTQEPVQGTQTTQRTGPKIVPQATITEVENRVSGQYLDVSMTIRNNSQVGIMLDKIILLGRTRELDRNLSPGEEFEFVSVYNGPQLANRNYTNCEVYYRDEAGDYFSAIHLLEFEQESDGNYTIRRARFIPPVKDI